MQCSIIMYTNSTLINISISMHYSVLVKKISLTIYIILFL